MKSEYYWVDRNGRKRPADDLKFCVGEYITQRHPTIVSIHRTSDDTECWHRADRPLMSAFVPRNRVPFKGGAPCKCGRIAPLDSQTGLCFWCGK